MLACGDLLASAGSLRDYFWCQWKYMDFQGHVNLMESLATVAGLQIDQILPGHGAPFAVDERRLQCLSEQLQELWEMFYGRPYEPFYPKLRQVSDHVYEALNTEARTYVIRDDDGHGLLIDSGYASNAPIAANPHRYIDHLTPHLEKLTGVHTVEYFLPTHYHDDHLAGYPALRARYGTRAAAGSVTADLLRHPERYDMPCLVPRGMDLERVVTPGEVFEWRGIRFLSPPTLARPGTISISAFTSTSAPTWRSVMLFRVSPSVNSATTSTLSFPRTARR